MTVLINASNTSGLTFTSDTSGNVAVQSNGTTVATISGTGANAGIQMGSTFAPAFRAGLTTTQNISSATATKIQFNSETFDTNSNYDNTTNYRFTPTVAGYYQINTMAQLLATGGNVFFLMIYKNGSNYQRCGAFYGSASEFGSSGSAIVYCNGTTDYIEVYAYINGTSPSVYGDVTISTFSGSYIRSA